MHNEDDAGRRKKVNNCDGHERDESLVGVAADDIARSGQICDSDISDDGGGLHQTDQAAAVSLQHNAHSLRQNDAAEGLPLGKTNGEGRLPLPFFDTSDGTFKELSHVRTKDASETDDRHCCVVDSGVTENNIVENHQYDDHGKSLHKSRVDCGKKPEHGRVRHGQGTEKTAQQIGECKTCQGDDQGDGQSAQNLLPAIFVDQSAPDGGGNADLGGGILLILGGQLHLAEIRGLDDGYNFLNGVKIRIINALRTLLCPGNLTGCQIIFASSNSAYCPCEFNILNLKTIAILSAEASSKGNVIADILAVVHVGERNLCVEGCHMKNAVLSCEGDIDRFLVLINNPEIPELLQSAALLKLCEVLIEFLAQGISGLGHREYGADVESGQWMIDISKFRILVSHCIIIGGGQYEKVYFIGLEGELEIGSVVEILNDDILNLALHNGILRCSGENTGCLAGQYGKCIIGRVCGVYRYARQSKREQKHRQKYTYSDGFSDYSHYRSPFCRMPHRFA